MSYESLRFLDRIYIGGGGDKATKKIGKGLGRYEFLREALNIEYIFEML